MLTTKIQKNNVVTRINNVRARYHLTYEELYDLTKWRRLSTLKGWGKKCEEYLQNNPPDFVYNEEKMFPFGGGTD